MDREHGTHRLRSIWCIPAPKSDKVVVIARYSVNKPGWTHLMHWTPDRGLEAGAWAKLRLVRHACRVDPTGEFFLYDGRKKNCLAYNDPTPEPFRATVGGGRAISRLPWLSAITDIRGNNSWREIDGGGVSNHALSDGDQKVLWSKFYKYSDDESWFEEQQLGWNSVPQSARQDFASSRWSAKGQVFVNRRASSFGELFACVISRWLDRGLASIQFGWKPRDGEFRVMKGVAWASISDAGHLLCADAASGLRVYASEPKEPPNQTSDWRWGMTLLEEHDISTRVPNPGPSPDWARAPLSQG